MMTSMATERDWKAEFEHAYAGRPSAVAERVWREVFGDEYPAGLDPFSAVSVSELERIAAEVRVAESDTIADLGCGRGGPGLWVALATGADLIGIDISSTALDAARERATRLGLGGRARFDERPFEDTGLPDASVDALISIDALLFSTHKAAALTEFRRILRPAARLVFTSCDYHRQPAGRPPQVGDHRPLLDAAGFEVLAYEETDDWHRRISDTTAGLLENAAELAMESGQDVETTTEQLREMEATIKCISRRILVVAQARSAVRLPDRCLGREEPDRRGEPDPDPRL
jgi:ubiquinone/menaquinone biosynthesis C-methylase UbiE